MLIDFLFRARNKNADIAAPPGFNPSIGPNHVEVAKETDQSHLILKKSWDLALAPVKQVALFHRNIMLSLLIYKILNRSR